MRLEVCCVIGMNDVGDSKTRYELVDKHASYRDCLLALKCVRLDVFGKVIGDRQTVSVHTLHARMRSNDVHG